MKIRRTLQVPMSEELYHKLQEHAERMGFDSAQAYIRFWATAETRGNYQAAGSQVFSGLTPVKTQALRYIELLLMFRQGEFNTVQQAVLWLSQQIRQDSVYRQVQTMQRIDKKAKL